MFSLGKHKKIQEEEPLKKERAPAKFAKPSLEKVVAYCKERANGIDPQQWYSHYEANGWRVGRNPMRDWKAAVRTWERNGFLNGTAPAREPIVYANIPSLKGTEHDSPDRQF